MPISPFRQTGPTIVLPNVGAAQCVSTEQGNQQYIVTNSDTTNDAYVAMGATAQAAQQNAVVPTTTAPQLCYRVLHASQITLTGPANAFFAAAAVGGSPRIDVTPGYGS